MSTTASSSWRGLPPGVHIIESVVTGRAKVIIRGRDEVREFDFSASSSAWFDRAELIRFIQEHMTDMMRREAKLDAVTKKLES